MSFVCQGKVMLLVETQLPVGIANKMGCTLFQQEMVDASAVQERLKPGFVADDLGIQNCDKVKTQLVLHNMAKNQGNTTSLLLL